VLLLQSLIIGCGLFFKQNYWGEIADALIRRLKDQLYFNLLKSKYFIIYLVWLPV
jgi:hypothetical protein